MPPFSGSYREGDVHFLLTPVELPLLDVEEKERRRQLGGVHYSEMLSPEAPPSDAYLRHFDALTERYAPRLAGEAAAVAAALHRAHPGPITLVSLARAGTPVGVLLTRLLRERHARSDVFHASVSIILGRGLDPNALRFLLRELRRPAEGVVFVDGWTAKGSIRAELARSVHAWNATEPEPLPDALTVLADPGGVAERAATLDDYPIPSGLLGGVVSGLVSRSVLTRDLGPGDFHGTVLLEDLRPFDRSAAFVDRVLGALPQAPKVQPPTPEATAERRSSVLGFLAALERELGVEARDRLKPGCAEATRALLRRAPGQLILRDPAHPDVAHLAVLAEERGVPMRTWPTMPYLAVATIERPGDARR
jgi:hypothetical protein